MRNNHLLILIAILFSVSCDNDIPNPLIENGKAFVDNLYYNNNLIAHFEYNKNNQLIKREYFNPFDIGLNEDIIFHYKDSLVSKIEYDRLINLQYPLTWTVFITLTITKLKK